jgi:putative hydrolase of the HAD superfamily
MIKAIVFDMGNVLVAFDSTRAFARLLPLCPHPIGEIRTRLRATGIVGQLETGKIEPEAFVKQFGELLDFQITYPEFCDLWSSIFLPEPIMPDSFLAALSENYPMIVLSNTNAIHFDMIRKNYGLLKHFDHEVLSHEVGAAKPQPEIYREAIRRAGCLPEECFFTDDIPEFIEGAKREGMDAGLFESPLQVQAELRSRGVSW